MPPPDPSFLSPAERDLRIAALAAKDAKKRCRAALELCHSARSGTDIAPAVPALAAVAALPHTGDLDAMWAQHALAGAAFHGADLRPALPALIGKLKDRVDQYAVVALRTWASRSTGAAAEVLAAVRAEVKRPDREFLEELEFLSKRRVADASAEWTTDRPRGVRVRAGRLFWLSSHGWDQEQSIPGYVKDGVPREMLRMWTGSWRVPLPVQNAARGWLGLPPLAETAQDAAMKRLETMLAAFEEKRFATATQRCALCSTLEKPLAGSPLEGFSLPATTHRLESVLDVGYEGSIRRCPDCGAFYQHKYERDCEALSPETDWEILARITPQKLRRLAIEAEFGTAPEPENPGIR